MVEERSPSWPARPTTQCPQVCEIKFLGKWWVVWESLVPGPEVSPLLRVSLLSGYPSLRLIKAGGTAVSPPPYAPPHNHTYRSQGRLKSHLLCGWMGGKGGVRQGVLARACGACKRKHRGAAAHKMAARRGSEKREGGIEWRSKHAPWRHSTSRTTCSLLRRGEGWERARPPRGACGMAACVAVVLLLGWKWDGGRCESMYQATTVKSGKAALLYIYQPTQVTPLCFSKHTPIWWCPA